MLEKHIQCEILEEIYFIETLPKKQQEKAKIFGSYENYSLVQEKISHIYP